MRSGRNIDYIGKTIEGKIPISKKMHFRIRHSGSITPAGDTFTKGLRHGAVPLLPLFFHGGYRSADEVIAVNEGVGDQLFPNDAGNLRQARGVESLLALRGAGVGDDEAQCLLKDIGQLAGNVAAVDVAFVLDLRADKGDSLDDESR
ncbi:hypothetical protein PPH94_011340 [Burkholderia cepacia]|uniref:hypothetical protein n=1 Tax=Burkholderia cepacia TaxID=292 RepID=UPI001C98AC1E|nr:hypothetical protein [Burkholderia cepacia]MBY4804637.1 hypothetical protein [Burkholderia cepacia]MCA8331373.1 hypothetical protein [Burkholderia cepacia]MDC6102375.1 hypothetical protein [Burkholderia cepacia]